MKAIKKKGVSNLLRISSTKKSPKINLKTDRGGQSAGFASNQRRDAGRFGQARYIARVREMAAQEAVAKVQDAQAKKHASEAAQTAQEEFEVANKELDCAVNSKAVAEQEVAATEQRAIATEREAQVAAELAKRLRVELEALTERASTAGKAATDLRTKADAAMDQFFQARDSAREASVVAKAAFRKSLNKKAAAVDAGQRLDNQITR